MKIQILSYPSGTNLNLSDKFIAGHRKVLSDFGIENVTSNSTEWRLLESSYIIVAIDKISSEVIGGIRINSSPRYIDLPLFSALGYKDSSISKWMSDTNSYGIAEVCGLWNAKKVFGKGISPLLTMCAVALCGVIPTNLVVGIAAPYTRQMSVSMGFRVASQFGDAGYFPYPNDKHLAALMTISDIQTLAFASKESRETIFELRRKLYGDFSFSYYPGVFLEVEYNL